MSDETTPGGSRILRHQESDGPPQISRGDPDLIEAIDAHLGCCFGKESRDRGIVFHELVSETIHLDVHFVAPSDEFPFHRLVTSGMAEAPMAVPSEFEESPFAELTIALPADWPLPEDWETSNAGFEDERVYWPIRLLKVLARLPHDYSTFLWHGHTIPNGDPPARFADDTELCCALIAPPLVVPDDFAEFEVGDGRSVRFLGVIPLYEDETRFKLDKGADALYDLFDEHDLTDIVDPRRPSIVPNSPTPVASRPERSASADGTTASTSWWRPILTGPSRRPGSRSTGRGSRSRSTGGSASATTGA